MNEFNQTNLPIKPSHHRLLWSALVALIVIVALLATGLILDYRANQNRLNESLQNLANNLIKDQNNNLEKVPERDGAMSLVADKTALAIGDILEVKILIDTKEANIVLAGAMVGFDATKLVLVGDPLVADSVLKMSILDEVGAGTVEIVRGNPGNADYLDTGNGYTGSGGLLATLKFKALSAGVAKISFAPDKSSLILDDGRGTVMKTKFQDLEVEIK